MRLYYLKWTPGGFGIFQTPVNGGEPAEVAPGPLRRGLEIYGFLRHRGDCSSRSTGGPVLVRGSTGPSQEKRARTGTEMCGSVSETRVPRLATVRTRR